MVSRRGLYTIAPHAKFLELLADRIIDGTLLNGWDRSGPFWLSDITIILPTRRARLTLAEIFAQRLGGAVLLPDIRTFGGESAEEEPFLPPVDAPAIKPSATMLERRLILSRLVRALAISGIGYASPPNAAEVLWLADSLGEVIDDFTIEDVRPEQLGELIPAELAENWQQALSFLDVVFKTWPLVLGERGQIDGATARNERLQRQAATAGLAYGERPVIAAGSTGSIPATATLLKAIAALPRGALVLPGLDTSLSATQHEKLVDGAAAHGHPQYGLAQLLRRLGAGIADVEELADAAPRTTMVRAALAPAEETTLWTEQRAALPVDDALAGMSVLAAPNADIEARAVALAARAAVAEHRSVGIVSRDQALARRIAAELKRHGIEVDDPAGTPLFQSGAGRLARQILAVAMNRYAPVDVVALLRNAAVTLGRERNDVRHQTNRLDFKLRDTRTRPGLAGMTEIAGDDDLKALLETLGAGLKPLCDLLDRPEIDAPALAGALAAALATLTDGADLPGLDEFTGWANELANVEDHGAPFPPHNLDAVLGALMAGSKVQSAARRRDDVHIWGELEARLMNPDVMILAGVNEEIWPAAADPGPWMSRGMRMGVGLMPPEQRQGQAAHDFEMALGNTQVLVAYATRMGGSPALPSRFLQRLDAFIGEDAADALRQRGAHWLQQAQAIDFAGVPRPAGRPMPQPPASMRPRRLSITEVEPLIRSPYDIYARHVLRLRKREPLGAEPDAKERGTMIHSVFERFVDAGLRFNAPDALDRLQGMAEEQFAGLDAIGERRDIWLKRFNRAARQFLDYEHERQHIVTRIAERKGEWTFPTLQNFVLVGKADRIDERADGLLEILDFKTGAVPSPADMKAYDAPQLLLEAALARAGIFPDVPPRDTAALTYLKIGLGPLAFKVQQFSLRKGMPLMAAVDEIERRLQGHVETFLLRGDLPMAARIRPRVSTGRKLRPGEFDHLARTDEWTLTAGVDDP
jgi:ATP-dependent helicase/nuclease subunit B